MRFSKTIRVIHSHSTVKPDIKSQSNWQKTRSLFTRTLTDKLLCWILRISLKLWLMREGISVWWWRARCRCCKLMRRGRCIIWTRMAKYKFNRNYSSNYRNFYCLLFIFYLFIMIYHFRYEDDDDDSSDEDEP